MLRIAFTSVLVDDQSKALAFYTDVLGFEKKMDMDLPGGARWITLVSRAAPNGVQLVLEPEGELGRAFKQGLLARGIPATSFAVDDIQQEYTRLSKLGVTFRRPPTQAGPVTVALLDDTCGNLVQLHQS
jgi:catechol 2,3-dioxygenase-like lactoylglutathione lyase family enzyme